MIQVQAVVVGEDPIVQELEKKNKRSAMILKETNQMTGRENRLDYIPNAPTIQDFFLPK